MQARTLVSKTSGILTDVWIETYRLPPFWSVNPAGSGGCLERRPCRLRHVTRTHRAPPFPLGQSLATAGAPGAGKPPKLAQ